MKKFKGDIVVGTVVLAGFMWLCNEANVFDKNNLENTIDETENTEYIDIRSFNKTYINNSNNFYHDYLKEAENKRLVALHNKRMKQLEIEQQAEKERLRKIEEEKQRKITETKKLNEKKKQQELSGVESNWKTFEATYYTPHCKGCSGVTATSIDVRNTITYNGYRIIATDPKVIPMWSLVEVVTPHETFTAIAGDKGGAIKGSRTDILVSTKKEAYAKGRHDVKIRVVGKLK